MFYINFQLKMSEVQKINIIVIGNFDTGKTNFIYKYISKPFNENYFPTIGVDFIKKILIKMEKHIILDFLIWQGKKITRVHLKKCFSKNLLDV